MPTCRELCLWCACAAAGLALTGCRREIVPVSGRVTLDGQPLAGAVVTFQPQFDRRKSTPEATGSVGRTGSDGRFSLRLVRPERRGAAVGTHVVTISAAVGGSDETPPSGTKLPQAWRDGSKKFRVPPGGTSQANFAIAAEPEPDILPSTKSKAKTTKSK